MHNMSWTQHQPVLGFPPPTESHLRSGSRRTALQQFFYPGALDLQSFWEYNSWLLSHFNPSQVMMEEQNYSSGDEPSIIEDHYSDCSPGIGVNMPSIRHQTTAAGVSSAASGRDSVPSHHQTNDKGVLGNEQMTFSSRCPATNAYNQSFAGNFDEGSAPWLASNTYGFGQPGEFFNFQDGLPNNTYYSPLPIFGGSPEYGAMTPDMINSNFSSSMGSSIASDRMASMTLEPAPAPTPTANLGQGWEGNLPATISPKMLRINPSPTPTSSSESIHNSLVATGDLDLGSSAFDRRHARQAHSSSSKGSSHKPRKELPDKPAKSRPAPLKSNGPPPSKHKPHHLARLVPMPEDGINHEAPEPAAQVPAGHAAEAQRSAKDEFLVNKRQEGMTYREIRILGNYTEAESTLRGRYRTLTKNKEARVRKPEWQDNDIHLLKKAVRKLARGDDTSSVKVPWKQVADYITEHGGSYHFGNATCRKKWDELVGHG